MRYCDPDRVAEGIRDFVTWRTGFPADAQVEDGAGAFTIRLSLPRRVVTDASEFEQLLHDFLLAGYTLDLEWTHE